jgi:hypothetical protein
MRASRLASIAALLVVGGVGFLTLSHRGEAEPRIAKTSVAPPFASGDDAANIALRRTADRVLLRWIARRTGILRVLDVRVKFSSPGYGGGSSGILRATTHPVRRDGRPRASTVLAQQELVPAQSASGGSIALRMGFGVEAGQEFATIIQNSAPDPSRDYFSANFLFVRRGLLGANARNEREPKAWDARYGLDPRELVGFSRDGGATWRLPGGPYGPNGGRAFLPTYVQEFVNGVREGQVYYWGRPISGMVTMVYHARSRPWTITHIGASSAGGSADVALAIDDVPRATATLRGTGFVSAKINPVVVPPGSNVELTTTTGDGGLLLRQLFADAVWARLARLGTGSGWYLDQEPETAVPLYPLPFFTSVSR